MLDFCGVRQADPANHNPPAATNAATAKERCFNFMTIVLVPALLHFCHGIMAGFWELTFDLERRQRILVRSAREQE